MKHAWNWLIAAALVLGVGQKVSAQAAPAAVLSIDIQNFVYYLNDTPDVSKLATDPSAVPSTFKPFEYYMGYGDIVAINGKPAKGTYVIRGQFSPRGPSGVAGVAIAELARNGSADETYDIADANGTSLGMIATIGFNGGTPPPGAPTAITGNHYLIIGGTGAFLGITGEGGNGPAPPAGSPATRIASMIEDPSRRRINGGGTGTKILYLIPSTRPAIIATPNGPAIVHSSDFKLVSTASPAQSGEILSIFATGLGPTRPGVDPGKPFPASPVAVVNSPLEVLVNGTPAEVVGTAGYPGVVDGYQVNFRMPSNAKGTASVQLTVAWVSGLAVSIPVQ